MSVAEIRKTIAALVTGVIGWFAVVVESGSESITSGEWIMLATIIATALGVFAIPNAVPPAPPQGGDH